jgi:hypothetical protein
MPVSATGGRDLRLLVDVKNADASDWVAGTKPVSLGWSPTR